MEVVKEVGNDGNLDSGQNLSNEGDDSEVVDVTVTNNGAGLVGRSLRARHENSPNGQMLCYGRKKRPPAVSIDRASNKKVKVRDSTPKGLPSAGKKQEGDIGCIEDTRAGSASGEFGQRSNTGLKRFELKWVDNGSSGANGMSATAKVKETLRVFNSHYLRFVQEEKRCRTGDVNDMKILKGSKINMLKSKAASYTKRRFGNLPGSKVGQQFFSQSEVLAVGFHGHSLKANYDMGIPFPDMEKYNGYKFPLAAAIVLSSPNGDHNSEEFVYTVQGGNDSLDNKHPDKDQEINRGNLALKNNMEQSVPVGVIRTHKCDSSYIEKVHIYDGLYKIIHFWPEKSRSGFTVSKYRLRRLPGQPKTVTNQKSLPKPLSEIPGLVCKDISNGQEPICIPATNIYDDPPVGPTGFTYVKSLQASNTVNFPPDGPGCNCRGNCTNPKTCSCAQLNGADFPYVRQNGGRLIESSDVVFECGPRCSCGPNCINRISQRGLKYQLEVYRTPNKGWAVRSWDFIPSGAPVCEYTGVLRKTDELENTSENEYIFEIDCWQTINEIGGRERRFRDVSVPSNDPADRKDHEKMQEIEYCIDAGSFGNVARFINHSCDPNLFVQCILSSHRDLKLARVVLFAADNIPPMQELTYDYCYALDSVIGPDGKVKQSPCFCGAACCRKRLY